MVHGLPGATVTPRFAGVRSTALVVAVIATGLAVVGVLCVVLGIFTTFSSSPAQTSSASAIAAQSAAAEAALGPAPTLVCPGSTSSAVRDYAAGATGDDTPLAATEQWLATVPRSDQLVDARQFAGPAGDPPGSRTIAWYDHDGTLRATASVIPAVGGWLLSGTSYCA